MAKQPIGPFDSTKAFVDHRRKKEWGKAQNVEQWAMLMYGWAWQVTNDIRAKHPDLPNPDDPPEPPWDA